MEGSRGRRKGMKTTRNAAGFQSGTTMLADACDAARFAIRQGCDGVSDTLVRVTRAHASLEGTALRFNFGAVMDFPRATCTKKGVLIGTERPSRAPNSPFVRFWRSLDKSHRDFPAPLFSGLSFLFPYHRDIYRNTTFIPRT